MGRIADWLYPPKEKEIDEYSEKKRELQDRVFVSYPVGCKFEYMGVEMTVRVHTRYRKSISSQMVYIKTIYPEILCEYVTKNGQILQHIFCCEEIDGWEK